MFESLSLSAHTVASLDMSDTESPEVPAAEPLTAASIRQLIREELAAAGRSAETATRSGDPLPAFSAPETASSSGKYRSDQLLMRSQLLSGLPRYQGARRAWVFFGLTVYLKAYCVPEGFSGHIPLAAGHTCTYV